MDINREKRNEQRKEYYLKNREHIKEERRKYYLKNREKKIEYSKEYQLKNKERHAVAMKKWRSKNMEHTRNWERNKYQTDANFKLKKICRSRIRHALKGINKSASTIKLIGCTIEELRKHIESQFEPWMTWKNHGLWDIDHIEACAKFDLTCPVQQLACFNWNNLQPMGHIENIKKGMK